MRIILCCLGLLLAAPAFANPVEDGLCHARPQSIEKMERSEKLCRAFVRAMGKLPGETMREVQALLSPESLALMGTMTTAWVGSQGIPVLGQTVDVALLTLGVAMAAAQTAAVKRRPAPERREAYQYQRRHAGPEELLVSGSGTQVWADGARMDSARLVEVKHIGAADNSPFVPGSKCDDYVRTMIQDEVAEEFSRYAAVINDPHTPAVALEVVLNESRAAPFFETLLQRFGIPGEVIVRP